MGASVNPVTENELEPISPIKTNEMCLDARKNEVPQSTLDGYHYRPNHFVRWCKDVEGIENANSLPEICRDTRLRDGMAAIRNRSRLSADSPPPVSSVTETISRREWIGQNSMPRSRSQLGDHHQEICSERADNPNVVTGIS